MIIIYNDMKTIIFFPIVLIAALYIVLGLAIPEFRAARSEQVVNEDKKKQLTDLENQLNEVKNFIAQIDQHQAEVSFLNTYVPSNASEHEIVNAMSKMASRHGVAITELSVSQKSNANSFGEEMTSIPTDASVSVDGEFGQIMAFLADTARITRVYDFAAGTIAKAEDQNDEFGRAEGDPNTISANVQFRFAHVGVVPKINASDFQDHISFESVKALQEVTKTTEPISLVGGQRQNPFIP